MSELIAAFLIDLWIGDPVYPFHPARIMGRIVQASEPPLRRAFSNPLVGGAVLAFFLPLAVFVSVWILLIFLYRVHFLLGWAMNVFGIYSSLSVRDLYGHGMRVYKSLLKNDLEKAQSDVARIVGRDTNRLDQKGIIRAAVETIAESTVDGVVAPLFYAALGGAPLALAYKAVNTLDSMIGHRNERYELFGRIAAKQDEAWNWVPARLSYYVITLAAFFVNRRSKEAFFTGWQDGMSAPHGNSAIPEAAFAGALGLRLGGVSHYDGRVIEKPFLGFPKKDFDEEDIIKALRLMITSAWISLVTALFLRYATGLCARLI